jgi:hypothetical protein
MPGGIGWSPSSANRVVTSPTAANRAAMSTYVSTCAWVIAAIYLFSAFVRAVLFVTISA